jgi:uncharacterized protein YlxW (UPF0749 family)
MSLLNDITNESLDAAYADHAARLASPDPAVRSSAPSTPGRRAVSIALLVLVGITTGTAVDQVRDRAAASVGVRTELVDEVQATTEQSDALVAEVAARRAEVARIQDAALGSDAQGRAAAAEVAALALSAGTVAVTGPGIVVTLDDPAVAAPDPSVTPRGGQPEAQRLTDRQLQAAVNAIWAAGAEAVTVNGVRLTSRTAIRTAGEAILVGFQPLSPPYVVQAVGDAARMEFDLLDSPVGRAFVQLLVGEEDFRFDVERAERLELPAALESTLDVATPVPQGPDAGSGP